MRTPRTRALELGTTPAGFDGVVNMEGDPARAGHPPMPGRPVTQYKEQPPAVGPGSSVQGINPFANLKGGH